MVTPAGIVSAALNVSPPFPAPLVPINLAVSDATNAENLQSVIIVIAMILKGAAGVNVVAAVSRKADPSWPRAIVSYRSKAIFNSYLIL